jgi:hypothetical protein
LGVRTPEVEIRTPKVGVRTSELGNWTPGMGRREWVRVRTPVVPWDQGT